MRKRDKTITIRCTAEEKNAIISKAQKHNILLSDFIIRSALGKKIVVADGLKEVARLQKSIGNNLNQIAMLANMDRIKAANLKPLLDEHLKSTQILCEIAKQVK